MKSGLMGPRMGVGGNLARLYRPLRGIWILLVVKPLTVISRERT